MDAAQIAGVDFIVNSVDNAQRELVQCVAGDLKAAYMAGIDTCKRIWQVSVPCRPDVVVISPGGFPRDFDLHQSQKAIGCAEMICRKGGRIILCAETRDGAGKPGKLLAEAGHPQEIIDRFIEKGYSPDALSKAFMLARAMGDFKIAVAASKIPVDQLQKMFFDGYETIEQAIDAAVVEYGEDAKFLVIPHASDIIPVLNDNG
jgi:nickel-dependent lactate racemase